MPTPVSTARQCLTEEAARALDDAVAVASRLSHSQTTSLHAVSALLSLSSSVLREACTHAQSSAYSPRLQFRALELSVGVSLDRLPSSKTQEDEAPPISNSLMAAIKRSQAIQRRHPEMFNLYQQAQQQSQFSLSSVKVELNHFILSILDDPIVSRVFGEAGYRSTDIKLVILNPSPPISRFSGNRYPAPLFLCNTPGPELKGSGLNFPFVGITGVEDADENCRRIGQSLVKKKAKNPLLIGFCAKDALSGFKECIERGKGGVLPAEIDGVSVSCIEKKIFEFISKNESEEMMNLKFKELGDTVERCTGSGIVVNYGELDVFVNGGSVDAVNFVVSRLSSLVEVHGEKLWLIGSAGSYEIYMKFVGRFPSIEKDWDLHLLPITSSTPPTGSSYSNSSLMGSFVPFGGFFPTPSELKNLFSSKYQSAARCDLCNYKYEHEVSAILKGGSIASVADRHLPSLSSWLQTDENDTIKSLDSVEAGDGGVQNARLMGVQRKWNSICQRLHHPRPLLQDMSQAGSLVPDVGSSQSDANRSESTSMPVDLPKISAPGRDIPIQIASKFENPSFNRKLPVEVPKYQQLEMKSPSYPSYPFCSLRHRPDHTSSLSVTSVTTDLGLGTLYASSEQECSFSKQVQKDHLLRVSGSVSAEIYGFRKNATNHITQSSSYSGPKTGDQLDDPDFKSLWKFLSDKVGWQDEAICSISQTVSSCRNGSGRLNGASHKGGIWFSFLGPDKVGKRRIAAALAEITRGSLLSVDLNSVNGTSHSNSIFGHQELNSYDINFRGKTVVDYISEELNRKPHSVVLLENIDKADFLAQNSLSQAIKTGKFPDSYGREISINNVIFVTTSSTNPIFPCEKENHEFSEERILGAKALQIQILVGSVVGDMTRTNDPNLLLMPVMGTSKQVGVHKRRVVDTRNLTEQDKSLEIPKRSQKVSRTCIDLNLPVEETGEVSDLGICESVSSSGNSNVWLEDLLDQVDKKVVFKPFEFDKLADKILKEIEKSFRKTIGFDVLLEIDPEVIVQILAAAWLSNNPRAVGDWVEQILYKSFVEAQQKHNLTSQSVVKLVALEGPVEERASNVCLPANISVN